MSGEELFGNLRSVLEGKPSGERFDALIDMIEGAMSEVDEGLICAQWIPYAERKLESWPDMTRRCREERLKRLEQEDVLWASLVRNLDYGEGTLSLKRAKLVCEATHLSGITCLDLRDTTVRWDVLHELAESSPFHLKHFALRKSTSSGSKPKDLIPLFTSPLLANLESLALTFWRGFNGKALGAMLENLPLASLKRLDLNGTHIGQKGLARLLACTQLENLEELDLGGLSFSKQVYKVFAEVTHFKRLRQIGLFACGFEIGMLDDLEQIEHFRNLELIDLRGNIVEQDELKKLCDVSSYPNLKTLFLECDTIPEEGLRTLFESECFENLETLHLSEPKITKETFPERVHMPELRTLIMYRAGVEIAGWKALTETSFWPTLHTLHMPYVMATSVAKQSDSWGGVRYQVARAQNKALLSLMYAEPLPEELEELNLNGHPVDEELMALLMQQSCASSLRSLYLDSFAEQAVYIEHREWADDGALMALARSDCFTRLYRMNVCAAQVSEDVLYEVAVSAGLPALREIYVHPEEKERAYNYWAPNREQVRVRLRARVPSQIALY